MPVRARFRVGGDRLAPHLHLVPRLIARSVHAQVRIQLSVLLGIAVRKRFRSVADLEWFKPRGHKLFKVRVVDGGLYDSTL